MTHCIYELPEIFKAIVINRPSKQCKSPYLADIRIITPQKRDKITFNVRSEECMAHSPSLGCAGLISSNSIVYVTKNTNTNTKSKYRIHLIEITEQNKKIIIGSNPNLANDIFSTILTSNIINKFNNYSIKREYTIGNSRIDFLLEQCDLKKILIEVKNVCLAYYEDIPLKELKKMDYSNNDLNSKISIFPDCNRKIQKNPISPRAIKHIDELIDAYKTNGYKSYLVFIIQRPDCKYFSPSKLDKTYYTKLKSAYKNKFIEILPIQIQWIDNKAFFKRILEFDKDFIN